jgi:hypothetical protein
MLDKRVRAKRGIVGDVARLMWVHGDTRFNYK